MDKIVLALGEYAVQLWKSAGLPHAKNATNFLKHSPAPTGQSRPDGNFPPWREQRRGDGRSAAGRSTETTG
jgi:hypothetical protein